MTLFNFQVADSGHEDRYRVSFNHVASFDSFEALSLSCDYICAVGSGDQSVRFGS